MGIDVPVEGVPKIICVFDAPIGYISSTKEWALREGKDWEPYWKDKTLSWFTWKNNVFIALSSSLRC
jgi:methionyl-tRNA synthetase